jgi:hypothetical protein
MFLLTNAATTHVIDAQEACNCARKGDTMRTWGRFTDISRRGCYVEVQATFPPGTKMYLLLELHEYRVHTKAVVGSRTRS